MLPSDCFSIAHVGVVTKGKRFHPKNPGVFRDSFGPSFTKFQLNKKKPAPPPPKKNLDLGSLLVKELLGVCFFALP